MGMGLRPNFSATNGANGTNGRSSPTAQGGAMKGVCRMGIPRVSMAAYLPWPRVLTAEWD